MTDTVEDELTITLAQIAAYTELVRVARLVLAELDERDGPICPPDDVRRPLRAALKGCGTYATTEPEDDWETWARKEFELWSEEP